MLSLPSTSGTSLKSAFSDIEAWFFNDPEDQKLNQKINGNSWSVRFSRPYTKKVVEIEEENVHRDGSKKFKRSVVIADVTFEHLKNYLFKCVDLKLQQLKSVCKSASVAVQAILDHVFFIITNVNDAPVVVIDKAKIMNAIDVDETHGIKELKPKIDLKVCDLIDQNDLSITDIEIIFYQIFSSRMLEIVDILNENLLNM